MTMALSVVCAVLALVVAVAIWVVSLYNGLVVLKNRFKNAYSQIDVQLKRRYDLIPNLVETAKGYLRHERETLEAVTLARNQAAGAAAALAKAPGDAGATRAFSAAESGLAGVMARLMAVVEKYPELKADAQNAHPGLKSDSVSVRAAQKNTQVAGKGSSITVTLGANSSTGLQAWQSKAYKDQLKYGWQNSITLGINIPIIDGGATTSKVLQAQVNETESQVSLKEDLKTLENNLEKLYLNAVSADMQWKAAILQVQAEAEALTVAEEQRNAGALTYTDFLAQKNNLEKAKITLTNAKYTSLLSRKLLDLYQGKLD